MPTNDKEKQKIYSARWYQKNKEKTKRKMASLRKENRRIWAEYKSSLSCVKCGASHPAIIDFHHVIRDKTKQSVNQLIGHGRFTAAWEEIKKCIPLCSNCHRILHWDEGRLKMAERKKKRPQP